MYVQRIHEGSFLHVSEASQDRNTNTYSCKVVKVDNNSVLIQSPFFSWDHERLPPSALYWLSSREYMFRYKAAINKYIIIDGFPHIEFKLLDDGESIQKRNDFRLNCHIPARIRLWENQDPNEPNLNELRDGTIINLSGGGAKFLTRLEMEEGDRIFIYFRLNGEELFLNGEIKAKYGNSTPSNQFQYGVMFCDVSASNQHKIVRYLFHSQNHLAVSNAGTA